ncbi:hypothetical protein ACHAXH_008775 [Discostella pseudostelligera]
MRTHSSLAVATLVIAAISPSDALALAAFSSASSSSHRPPQFSSSASALSYSHGGESDGENLILPQQFDPKSIRRLSSWRIPQRAIPRVQTTSKAEAASQAGFIIRQHRGARANTDTMVENRNEIHQNIQTERKARPLRTIRRIVLRQQPPLQLSPQSQQLEQGVQHNLITPPTSNRLSLSNHPQLNEILDTSDLSVPTATDPEVEQQNGGARRVTFKATKEASKAISSKHFATLTDFMTQPVSQYSLLSYHDNAEGITDTNTSNHQSMMSRRWLIRRLTKEESRVYIHDTPSSSSISSSSSSEDTMEESNLFRLAVPLLPLIGWDLTPVIDLEVIPPKKESVDKRAEHGSLNRHYITSATSNNSWAPLQEIRKRISHRSGHPDSNRDSAHSPRPVVKIRSLRVSLLSTQKEVNEVMMNKSKSGAMNQKGRGKGNSHTMQKEAIEMVGRVEEWLKPHITFEAEISWNDGVYSSSSSTAHASDDDVDHNDGVALSNVTVKSTAITSLTVPKIPSEILRKSVPSVFLVKRLGATLTSRALAICLPRFLTQLEKDYNRWSGL